MTESEFKKEFGMSFDQAYQALLEFRQESDTKWMTSIDKATVSDEVKSSISYKIKCKLKLEANLELLRSAGYDV